MDIEYYSPAKGFLQFFPRDAPVICLKILNRDALDGCLFNFAQAKIRAHALRPGFRHTLIFAMVFSLPAYISYNKGFIYSM
jgi:hypothetical protein